jgi:hypothetical protein
MFASFGGQTFLKAGLPWKGDWSGSWGSPSGVSGPPRTGGIFRLWYDGNLQALGCLGNVVDEGWKKASMIGYSGYVRPTF